MKQQQSKEQHLQGTEKDCSKGLEEDHTILPQISLQKYAMANEGIG